MLFLFPMAYRVPHQNDSFFIRLHAFRHPWPSVVVYYFSFNCMTCDEWPPPPSAPSGVSSRTRWCSTRTPAYETSAIASSPSRPSGSNRTRSTRPTTPPSVAAHPELASPPPSSFVPRAPPFPSRPSPPPRPSPRPSSPSDERVVYVSFTSPSPSSI